LLTVSSGQQWIRRQAAAGEITCGGFRRLFFSPKTATAVFFFYPSSLSNKYFYLYRGRDKILLKLTYYSSRYD